jgi:hypothetical protein
MFRISILLASIALTVAAGCNASPSAPPRVDHVEPAFGPLVGGTIVRLDGEGFAAGTRVLVGGREPPFVKRVSDVALEIAVPPGAQPGDAEVVVFDTAGTTSVRGVFRYSDLPAIVDVSPVDVWSGSFDTVVTVTGSGFLDEEAGPVRVVVGSVLVDPEQVTVTSDTSLTFIAPSARPFLRADVEVIDDRGMAVRRRAVRYTPGRHPGLLLFSPNTGELATFYDPVDETWTSIPKLTSEYFWITTAVRDRAGDYWTVDYANHLGRLDLDTQTTQLVATLPDRIPAATRVGDDILAVSRNWNAGASISRLDLTTTLLTPIAAAGPFCCGGFGIATDGTTVWFTSRQDWTTIAIRTFDPVSGTIGTPVPLTGVAGFRPEELRYLGGTLYATSASGGLATIDPATGVVTMLPQAPVTRFRAIEVFE